jgi:hypothetical protein
MPANTAPIFVLTLNNKGQSWTHADAAATTKDLFVAGANGSRLASVAASSTDTSAIDVQLLAFDGSTAWLVSTVTVAIGAGNTGAVAAQNLLSLSQCPWLNSDGSLTLPSGWKLQASNVTQVTAAKTLTLVSLGADY